MAARSEAWSTDADGGTKQFIHWYLRGDRSGAGLPLHVTDVWSAVTLPPVHPRVERQLMHVLSAGLTSS